MRQLLLLHDTPESKYGVRGIIFYIIFIRVVVVGVYSLIPKDDYVSFSRWQFIWRFIDLLFIINCIAWYQSRLLLRFLIYTTTEFYHPENFI